MKVYDYPRMEPLAKNAKLPILIVPTSFEASHLDRPRRILFAVKRSNEVLPTPRFGASFASPETLCARFTSSAKPCV
jgi:hypothetical protein